MSVFTQIDSREREYKEAMAVVDANRPKHTPVPWEAVGNLVRSPMYQPEGLPRGVQIAECRDGYFNPHSDEAKANARLIAAAPELLDALIEARSQLEAYALSEGEDYNSPMINSAIAKAGAA